MRKLILVILILALIGIFFCQYSQVFKGFFFQDDWFLLKISSPLSYNLLDFFKPNTNVIFYRPLGMQIPFYFWQKVFGLNYLFFQLFNSSVYLFFCFLVYLVIKKISKNKNQAVFTSILCLFSLSFYTIHYWLAAFSFLFGATICLISVFFYLKFKEEKRSVYWLICFVLFVLGLFTNEVVFILPILLIGLQLIIPNRKLIFKQIVPFFLVESIFLWLRFKYFAPPLRGEYSLKLGTHIIQNLKGYLLWSLNWPEDLRYQFISFFQINPLFIATAHNYFLIFTISFILLIVILVACLIILFIRSNKIRNLKVISFYLFWYVLSLSPVLLFKGHSFSYHMPLSTVAFCGLIAYILTISLKQPNKLIRAALPSIFLIIWVFTANVGIQYNYFNHWAPRRSQISKVLLTCLTQNVKKNPQLSSVNISFDPENILSLNNQDAVNLLLGPSVRTIYTNGINSHCRENNP